MSLSETRLLRAQLDFMRRQSIVMDQTGILVRQQQDFFRHMTSHRRGDNVDILGGAPIPQSQKKPPEQVLRPQWDDDVGWSTVLQTALKLVKERVKYWQDSLDTTLLFIALFSAIVTAFLLPTLSALSPAPGQNTDQLLQNLADLIFELATLNNLRTPTRARLPEPFVPARSDEISAALWYSSLILSILCAGLSTLARFQMIDIQATPKGLTFIEKVMRLKDREHLARMLLDPTFDALNWTIVFAIALFMGGLLYQLWTLHSAILAPVILAIAVLGTGLAGLVGLFIVFVSLHAIVYDESPFETSFSRAVRFVAGQMRGSLHRDASHQSDTEDPSSKIAAGTDSVKNDAPILDQQATDVPQRAERSTDDQIDRKTTETGVVNKSGGSSWKALSLALFEPYSDIGDEEACRQFFKLVAESESLELLERSVPTMVECFDHINPLSARDFSKHVEPAIARALDPEVKQGTKLLLLQNLPRIKRELFQNFEDSARLTSRLLLRIQEGDAESENNRHMCIAAFRALVFFTEQKDPITHEYPSPPGPEEHDEVIIRGLQSKSPIQMRNALPLKSESGSTRYEDDSQQVSRVFLGALLEFSHLSFWSEYIGHPSRHGVFQGLKLPEFIPCYIGALHWSNAEIGKWDHRVRYRRILADIVRLMLDSILIERPEAIKLGDLKFIIENIGEWIDTSNQDALPQQRIRTCQACIAILRRLRVPPPIQTNDDTNEQAQLDLQENSPSTKTADNSQPELDFSALARIFPAHYEEISEHRQVIGRRQIAIATKLELVSLRHREALLFFIDKHGSRLCFEKPGAIQFLADCKAMSTPQDTESSPEIDNAPLINDDLKELEDAEDLRMALDEGEKAEVKRLHKRMGAIFRNPGPGLKSVQDRLPQPSWQQDPTEHPAGTKGKLSTQIVHHAQRPLHRLVPSKNDSANGKDDSEGWLRKVLRMAARYFARESPEDSSAQQA
ncbi:hypothetical protein SISSUDRAFT_1118062 [Sistotremastrum suecicum HHB10207 ss-3]|uniref:DUF6535 domain-containing protein n=1 Tax=Sistotremastrum suecicum HHB10207 ss-3 TaxID=1314776 RepID=A0A166FLL7_9AGAM|nr:hypothetical protein SISSUDRAFT_1118062 [Sistotremastrum suecicum HHB10207 ss-3]